MDTIAKKEQDKIARKAMTALVLTLKMRGINFYLLPESVQQSYVAVYLAGVEDAAEALMQAHKKALLRSAEQTADEF